MKSKSRAHKKLEMAVISRFDLGANRTGFELYLFKVWAPRCQHMKLKLFRGDRVDIFSMARDADGYFTSTVSGVKAGMRYCYVLDAGQERPDPVSRFLPDGLHKTTEIIDPDDFAWKDKAFKGIAQEGLIVYEAHIGTFTSEGTFEAAITKLPYLKKLGINCLEILPVAQFPGMRNWGYDGANLFAVQKSYGGPIGLKRLVDACHRSGIAVCLDVVYNHFGPEGNYLREFGPYFTNRYQVPWGEAVNFDGWDSDPVRHFFIENACYWVREFHMDALRLDAVHAIYDFSAKHILEEINASVEEQARVLGRQALVIAESDLNDSRLIRSLKQGGYGLAAQWSDDFHHAVHTLLTGERAGYYEDFGSLEALAKAVFGGFVYDGQYALSRHRRHGNVVKDLLPEKLVVSIQNHDQVGNRALGDRFGTLLSFEAQKLAASLLLLSVHTPMLFMGEEFGEKAPFLYFIDHEDAELVRLVREGRQKEFASFGWNHISDPKAEETFLASKLKWDRPKQPQHSLLLKLYRDLIKLRKTYLSGQRRVVNVAIIPDGELNSGCLAVEYAIGKAGRMGGLFSFSKSEMLIKRPFHSNKFTPVFCSGMSIYGGSASCSIDKACCEIKLLPFAVVFGKIG